MKKAILIFCCLCMSVFFLSACSTKYIGLGKPPIPTHASMGVRVAQTAVNQLGSPYRLGGTSPQAGFDCSGLIQWSFAQHGISVPRVTTGQARGGKSISYADMRVGDVIVFRSSNSPNGLHTGIYIGHNKFVHAPNKRSRVKLDKVQGGYWGKYVIKVRRYW